jgi:hypothetical protein
MQLLLPSCDFRARVEKVSIHVYMLRPFKKKTLESFEANSGRE